MRLRAALPFAFLVAALALGGVVVYQNGLASQNGETISTGVIEPLVPSPVSIGSKVPTTPPPYSFKLPDTPDKPLVATQPLPAKK